jgi:DsbC/DsbD-like thiol-disulfide interchange protein
MIATLPRAALAISLIAPAGAHAARSDWAAAEKSQLRVLLAPLEAGRVAGGIEIVLEPGWYTYWRNPGEAGVPPVFDFSGSTNVAGVEVRYPTPERHDDGVSVSLIYKDEVVFPLEVTPLEPGRPVTVRVYASFGVCREICIPTEASSSVTLAPSSEPDPLTGARLALYEPRVPGLPQPGYLDVEEVVRDGDALIIDVRMPESSYSTLLAEPPQGWFIGQPDIVSRADGVSRYRLPLGGKPLGSDVRGQRFRFVAVAGGEAVEEAIEIR